MGFLTECGMRSASCCCSEPSQGGAGALWNGKFVRVTPPSPPPAGPTHSSWEVLDWIRAKQFSGLLWYTTPWDSDTSLPPAPALKRRCSGGNAPRDQLYTHFLFLGAPAGVMEALCSGRERSGVLLGGGLEPLPLSQRLCRGGFASAVGMHAGPDTLGGRRS